MILYSTSTYGNLTIIKNEYSEGSVINLKSLTTYKHSFKKFPSLTKWEWESKKATKFPLHGCKIIPPHVLSALFGLIYRPRDFASYMLGIFICNLLLYLAFYIIMKVSTAAGSLGASLPQALHRQYRQLGRLCFSPTAPQLREGPPHPILLHHCHGGGVGRCPVFFLPESQQLGGKWTVCFSKKMFSLHLAF